MAKEILSIRLSADGLSFWTEQREEGSVRRIGSRVDYSYGSDGKSHAESAAEAASEYCGILASHCRDMPQEKKLYSDSLGYVLVPEELFREGDAEKYFGLHGIESKEEEYTVCSKPVCGTVAILRLEKKVMEKLGSRLGAFDVAHMLQYNMEQDACIPENSHRIRVYISPRLCHITAYDAEGLVVAESYPADSAADVAYYLDCITGRYGLSSDIPVVVDGHRAEEVAAIVSRNFKGVRCV